MFPIKIIEKDKCIEAILKGFRSIFEVRTIQKDELADFYIFKENGSLELKCPICEQKLTDKEADFIDGIENFQEADNDGKFGLHC